MIVVIPFHSRDVELLFDLLEWCQVLDGCSNHKAILVADRSVSWVQGLEAIGEAEKAFAGVTMIAPPEVYDAGWPVACNQMFLFAAEHMVKVVKQPWLWLEPDAIPLKAGWLDMIERDYVRLGKPYMGAIIQANMKDRPITYLNGVAVYPADAFNLMGPLVSQSKEAFDVVCTKALLPVAANTQLIHCNWGNQDEPPVFMRGTHSIMNGAMTLDSIRPQAVLFHRNKDGSLLNLLRETKTGVVSSTLAVVLPFCNKDLSLMLKNIQWMCELGPQQKNHAILCYPKDVSPLSVQSVERVARKAFSLVSKFVCPGSSHHAWPVGPNIAFQGTARHMAKNGSGSWLWLEADAIPLKPNWLAFIEREYVRRKRSFFGPIVQNRGHMNGVAIYPKDITVRCPQSMAATNDAWDWVMGGELGTDVFDASLWIQHCWGIVGGQPHPHDGAAPHFASADEVRKWVMPQAMIFHRCKDGSLIDRMREMRNQ